MEESKRKHNTQNKLAKTTKSNMKKKGDTGQEKKEEEEKKDDQVFQVRLACFILSFHLFWLA